MGVGGQWRARLVSILVLLELPFDQCPEARQGRGRCVSILVLLELPFDHQWQDGTLYRAEFQSLFYWNCRLIPAIICSIIWIPTGFNPCFIGIAVWSISLSGLSMPSRCFNPCFIGIAVWSTRETFDTEAAEQFQSLFYWNCRLIDSLNPGLDEQERFQSLFYWNCRLIDNSSILSLFRFSFHSLFSWDCRLI